MVILKNNDKEFKLIPRTKKVVDLTDKLKAKNLHELIFKAFNDNDLKVLAEIIKAFAEDENGKDIFTSINVVYEFIDNYMNDGKTIADLYKEVILVVNDMGFLKTKMTEEEVIAEMDNPMPILDLKELAINSAQKMMDKVAEEEFMGYQG